MLPFSKPGLRKKMHRKSVAAGACGLSDALACAPHANNVYSDVLPCQRRRAHCLSIEELTGQIIEKKKTTVICDKMGLFNTMPLYCTYLLLHLYAL